MYYNVCILFAFAFAVKCLAKTAFICKYMIILCKEARSRESISSSCFSSGHNTFGNRMTVDSGIVSGRMFGQNIFAVRIGHLGALQKLGFLKKMPCKFGHGQTHSRTAFFVMKITMRSSLFHRDCQQVQYLC